MSKNMLVSLTLGFIVFGILLAVLTFFREYTLKEPFSNPPRDGKTQIVPGAQDATSQLAPGMAFSESTEKLLDGKLLSASEVKQYAGYLNSERCYRADVGESLARTRNYLQRTNNYKHTHPDSCSAPNHDFIGTFYSPFNGVGLNPSHGGDYPKSIDGAPEGSASNPIKI